MHRQRVNYLEIRIRDVQADKYVHTDSSETTCGQRTGASKFASEVKCISFAHGRSNGTVSSAPHNHLDIPFNDDLCIRQMISAPQCLTCRCLGCHHPLTCQHCRHRQRSCCCRTCRHQLLTPQLSPPPTILLPRLKLSPPYIINATHLAATHYRR